MSDEQDDPWAMPKKSNVKNTNSGKIRNSYKPDVNAKKINRSKKPNATNTKNKQSYVNARLTVDSVARLDAYQKINGMSNRSEALNKLLDKVLPQLSDAQKSTIHIIEALFKKNHKGRSW